MTDATIVTMKDRREAAERREPASDWYRQSLARRYWAALAGRRPRPGEPAGPRHRKAGR